MSSGKNPHAVAMGKLGGAATSPAKAAAARANGLKGGRPIHLRGGRPKKTTSRPPATGAA